MEGVEAEAAAEAEPEAAAEAEAELGFEDLKVFPILDLNWGVGDMGRRRR